MERSPLVNFVRSRVQVMTEHYELAWKPVRPVNREGDREEKTGSWTGRGRGREEPVPLVRRVKNGFALFFLSLSLPFPSFFSLPSNRFNLNTSWTDYPALIEKRKKKKKRERRGEGNCNHLGCRSLNESGWIRRRLETHTHTHTRESGKEPAVIAQFIESLRS